MTDLNEQITKIVPKEQIDELATAYKLRLLKDPSKSINLVSLCKSNNIGRRKYDKITALLGGAEHLHRYLAQTISLEKDNIHQLLNETIDAQRKAIPDMTPKERNDLLAILIKVNVPDSTQQVNINMDSFLKQRDIIDAD